MDRARQRFASNVELLKAHNPALSVMGDRDWTNACRNQYIQYMAKKLWLYEYKPHEVLQVEKAVLGYLDVEARRAEAQPVESGNRIIKGEVFSVKQNCRQHENAETCGKHWYMSVRDSEQKNTIYTPIPDAFLTDSPRDLIGSQVSFYAYITASERDHTFGFAHRPKLMTIERESNASKTS